MIFKTPPWSHQRAIVEYIDANQITRYGLFWDMGTGKTKTASDILRLWSAHNLALLKTLIIGPLSVIENWKRELIAHTYIDEREIQVIDGLTKRDGTKVKNATKKIRMSQLDNSHAKIFILNTDNVSNASVWDVILKMNFECLIVDESHRFKAPKGKRAKNMHELCRGPELKYRLILTGTPILQSALDLWSQFYIIDETIFGGNYWSFLRRYFYDKNAHMPSHIHFPNWQPKDAAYFRRHELEIKDLNLELNSIIYQHTHRVMKDEVLDLPERTYIRLAAPLVKEQARIYADMRDDAVAFLTKKPTGQPMGFSIEEDLPEYMAADLAIVKILRLQQLICGIFTTPEGKIVNIETERLKLLEETLADLLVDPKNKIIIWSVFAPTYKELAHVCNKVLDAKECFVKLTGQQTKDEKQKSIDEFNTDPLTRVIIANQGAGGTGVNLTAANYDLYYSRSFNLEHDLQSNARSYRGGQTRKTTRIDIVTPDTIDEEIINALERKRLVAEDILENKNLEFTKEEIIKLITKGK